AARPYPDLARRSRARGPLRRGSAAAYRRGLHLGAGGAALPGGLRAMKRIVVLGGGGHAKVVMEVLLAAGWEVAGYTDASGGPGDAFGAIPWLGDDGALPAVRAGGIEYAIVALGDNALRGRLADRAAALGFTLGNAIHPSAQISPSVVLGNGIAVMA